MNEGEAAERVDWGKVNVPLSSEHYEALKADVIAHLNPRDLWVHDARAGSDDRYTKRVRVVSESPWHAMFAYNMFLRLRPEERSGFDPAFTVYHAPTLQADPARHGTNSSTFIVVNFSDRAVLIGGTQYAGEIKKSIFSVLNFELPAQGVLPMHCSANIGPEGDTALFFGLSGTGKTTLSADPERGLIGDDEHGWSEEGVFNFEGGCYAKTIRLSPEGEPDIYRATRMFGTILENVVLSDCREVDYDDGTITQNTRASYPHPLHPQRRAFGSGRASQQRRVPHCGCLRRSAADLPPDAGTGHVPFPLRIHGQGRGNRARSDGAPGHLQRLLRGPVLAAASLGLRGHAR